MPCANTSSRPALRAKSMSMWIGLWSPEAPAYSASVVREIAGNCSAGMLSPTCMSCNAGVAMFSCLHELALHQGCAQIGDVRAVLVADARLLDQELECSALLVVDVDDLLLVAEGVAGVGLRVVVVGLPRVRPAPAARASRPAALQAMTGRWAERAAHGGRQRAPQTGRSRSHRSRRWPAHTSARRLPRRQGCACRSCGQSGSDRAWRLSVIFHPWPAHSLRAMRSRMTSLAPPTTRETR